MSRQMQAESGIEAARKRAYYKKKTRGDQYSMKKVKNILGSIIVLAQTILSILFIGYMDRLDILPMKYFSIVFAVLIVFLMLVIMTQFLRKAHIFGKIVGVLLCGVLIAGNVYMSKTVKTFDEIDKAGTIVTNEFTVIVKSQSKITSIKALSGKTVGVMKSIDDTIRDDAVAKLKKEIGSSIKIAEYEHIGDLMNALMDGKTDAIMYNSSYDGILKENYEGFENNTRKLAAYSVEREIKVENDKAIDTAGITKTPFIVYISGNDEEGKVNVAGRSDVNLLVCVNPITHKILIVNTPRDYYVYVPGVTPSGWRDKLTHAGNSGIDVSMKTLENLYGIDINYYARINFTSYKAIIDILGGITINNAYAFQNAWYYPAGEVPLETGDKALDYVRARYMLKDGDNDRGKNQMAVLKGIINKVLSPAILTSYMDLLDATSSLVQTNFPTDNISALVKMQLDKNPNWKMDSIATQASGSGYEPCYSYLVMDLSVQYVDQKSVDSTSQKIEAFMNER